MPVASSNISEEMIKLSFLECFHITIFLRYSFVTTSSVFCFLFFSFKVQSKIGVRIIYGRALYTGKYGIDGTLLIAATAKECSHDISTTINLLESLGFHVNYEKSVLTPSQFISYLGFIIDTM